MTNSANVSLLNNFEIVATSMIALVIFKEAISKRLWFAIDRQQPVAGKSVDLAL